MAHTTQRVFRQQPVLDEDQQALRPRWPITKEQVGLQTYAYGMHLHARSLFALDAKP